MRNLSLQGYIIDGRYLIQPSFKSDARHKGEFVWWSEDGTVEPVILSVV
jgi:hypothetical protein